MELSPYELRRPPSPTTRTPGSREQNRGNRGGNERAYDALQGPAQTRVLARSARVNVGVANGSDSRGHSCADGGGSRPRRLRRRRGRQRQPDREQEDPRSDRDREAREDPPEAARLAGRHGQGSGRVEDRRLRLLPRRNRQRRGPGSRWGLGAYRQLPLPRWPPE